MLEILPSVFESYKRTCPIRDIEDGCVTFIRNENYFKYKFGNEDKDAWVIIPDNEYTVHYENKPDDKGLKYFKCKYPEYLFTLFHNAINKDRSYQVASIGVNCKLDENVILGVQGLKVVYGPNDKKVQFVHTGRVDIEGDVEIGPYSVIHRGTMESTIIRQGCRFGAFTNIAHNCDIGENTIMAVGVILNGGVKVEKNCWFGSGALVKNHVTICEDVVVGMGAVVVKDITKPGIYVGNPAKYLKDVEEGWNF